MLQAPLNKHTMKIESKLQQKVKLQPKWQQILESPPKSPLTSLLSVSLLFYVIDINFRVYRLEWLTAFTPIFIENKFKNILYVYCTLILMIMLDYLCGDQVCRHIFPVTVNFTPSLWLVVFTYQTESNIGAKSPKNGLPWFALVVALSFRPRNNRFSFELRSNSKKSNPQSEYNP